jgi:hypothetical protein
MYQQIWCNKVLGKLYLGIRKQAKLNTTGLEVNGVYLHLDGARLKFRPGHLKSIGCVVTFLSSFRQMLRQYSFRSRPLPIESFRIQQPYSHQTLCCPDTESAVLETFDGRDPCALAVFSPKRQNFLLNYRVPYCRK